jgi:head-tail adaptor
MQIGGAGRARAYVEIQRLSTTRSGPYNEPEGYATLRGAWVQIASRFGSERFTLGSTESAVSQILRGEYLEWQDVTEADRVVFDGVEFNIKAVRLDRNNRREAIIDLMEVRTDPDSLLAPSGDSG